MSARKTIHRASFHLRGDSARSFLAALMDDARIKEELNNDKLAPEMREAIVAEAAKRNLIPGNFQI